MRCTNESSKFTLIGSAGLTSENLVSFGGGFFAGLGSSAGCGAGGASVAESVAFVEGDAVSGAAVIVAEAEAEGAEVVSVVVGGGCSADDDAAPAGAGGGPAAGVTAGVAASLRDIAIACASCSSSVSSIGTP